MTDDRNPYLPPTAQTAPEPVDASNAPLAGKGRRFGTFLVDYGGFYLTCALIGVVMGTLYGQKGVEMLLSSPPLLLGSIIYFAYYLLFEGLWGRTPGKLIFGTRVVDTGGRKPSLIQILKRTASRLIPFEAFTFFGERGLHDRISATQVILTRRD